MVAPNVHLTKGQDEMVEGRHRCVGQLYATIGHGGTVAMLTAAPLTCRLMQRCYTDMDAA
jgi:hypothetical protein